MKFIPIKKLPEASKGEFLFKKTVLGKSNYPYVPGHWNARVNLWAIAGSLVEHKELHAEGYTHFVKIEEE